MDSYFNFFKKYLKKISGWMPLYHTTYMTSISKNVYIDKLDDIVHKYNNKKHRTIKMKPIDVKDNTYIDFGK